MVIEGLTDFLSGPAEMALQELVKVIKVSDHLLIAESETSTLIAVLAAGPGGAIGPARAGPATRPDRG